MFSPENLIARFPVLRRIVPSVLRRYARTFKHRYSVEKRMGALFLIDQENSVDRNLLIKGAWEPRQVETLLRLINETKKSNRETLFLDVGAHGAMYSIIIAQHSLADRIIAFEPEPTNLAQLRANLFLNHLLHRIEVLEVAAHSQRGRIQFHVAKADNRGSSRMTEEGEANLERKIEVDAAPIDELVKFGGGLLVAKIDVEGSELTVLSGMSRLIAANRCLFQIECFDQNLDLLKARMAGYGFKVAAECEFDRYFVKERSG